MDNFLAFVIAMFIATALSFLALWVKGFIFIRKYKKELEEIRKNLKKEGII